MTAATKAKGAAKQAGKAESAASAALGGIGAELNGRFGEFTGLSQTSFDEAVDMGEEVVVKVRDFVEQEPWKAVAIAGAVGLLIGLAARR